MIFLLIVKGVLLVEANIPMNDMAHILYQLQVHNMLRSESYLLHQCKHRQHMAGVQISLESETCHHAQGR